jgi:hypothetical protein
MAYSRFRQATDDGDVTEGGAQMRSIEITPNLALEVSLTTEEILADLNYPIAVSGLPEIPAGR